MKTPIHKMPLADYFISQGERRLSQCPYHRAILVGAGIADFCSLNDYKCGVAYGNYECEEWNKIKEEDNGNTNAPVGKR